MRSRRRLDDFARFDDRLDVDAFAGAAIVFGDDHVLRHVAQAAGQVAGIGRLQTRYRPDPYGRRASR